MRIWFALCLVIGAPAAAQGQQAFTYRGRLTAEASSLQMRAGTSPAARDEHWQQEQRFVGALDAAWTAGSRLRLGAAGVALGSGAGAFEARVRELYARASAASWLDLEAGKRIVRWGVGYGFSPAGVLDPPRLATDPTDRLQVNEGRLMARADLYRGDTGLTVAAAERLAAARLTSVLRGGVELALIGAAGPRDSPRYGATVTHVIGHQLEWHAEALLHRRDGARVVSAVAGIQYTFRAGVNMVVEYHRNAAGFSDREWQDVLSGRRLPGARPSRRNLVFARAARAGGDVTIAPELIVLWGLDDGGWTVVPSLTWTPHRLVQAHVRVTWLEGPRRSLAGASPLRTSVTTGIAVRF